MGKKLLRKLGSVLRVFRARRRKNVDTSNDESTALTNSESLIKTSDTSSSQQVVYFGNSIERKKSVSLENIAVSAQYSTDNLNKLKRTHATCDIFEAEPNNPIRCTKSLHRFCKLNEKRCLLSYNATLHGGATWSQALSRAITPYTKREEKDTSSTTQAESEPLLPKRRDYFESYGLMKLHTIDTKKIYSSKERVVEETTTTSSQYTDSYIQSEKTDDSSKSNYVATTRQQNTEKYSTSFSSDVQSVEISDQMQEPSEATGAELSSADNKSIGSFSKSKEEDVKSHVVNSKTHSENRETYNCIKSKTERTTSRISTNNQTSQILLEKQRVQVNMEFQTVRNEEGFALLKYDMDGNPAKRAGSFLDMCANKLLLDEKVENGIRDCDASLTNNTSSKTQSGNSTEYDVGNMAQVDLLEEFRTTIANMRNVLDAIEVKKSIEGIIRQSMSEKTLNEHISKFMEPNNMTNLPTHFNTVCNQLSTSTDVDFWSSRNKGCRTILPSSDIVSNNSKRYDSSVSKSMRPVKNVQKRKRRRKIDAKLSRKPANHAMSSSNKMAKVRVKPEKPQYNKCVVYHITQHKQAADRCVGTSRPSSKKESVVLHETFSALHFGPIQEFPVLLHKHENEELKNRELKDKTKQEEKLMSSSSVKKLTFKELNRVRSEMEAKGDKTSSATPENKTTSSYMSSPSTTANWFVFDPAPPLILENNQPTSDDTVFGKNSSSCSTHDKPLEEDSKDDSNDMDLVKYEAGSKGDEVSKDMSHITITVNVPIKKILSRLKNSEKKSLDGMDCDTLTDGQRKVVPNNLLCDFGIQVKKSNNSTSVQTTPKGNPGSMPHINDPKDSKTSLKRLSSFKKIFGRKALGLNTSSGLVQTPSIVHISDRSTSCPRFYKTGYNDPKCTDKNVSVELKGTKYVVPQDMSEFGVNTNLEKEGFFLNLPRSRYRKKRQQISRLFDGSDSSNSKFFEDSKLLYHVHDSSFYSSSKTEQEPFSKLITSKDDRKMSYVPIHSVTSSVDIKLEHCNSETTVVPSPEENEKKPNDIDKTLAPEGDKVLADETDEVEADKLVKGVILKILEDKTFADLGVQCDKFVFLSQGEVGINTTNEVTHTERETDTYFKVDDLFLHNIPKVRFEDEVYAIRDEEDSGFKSRFTTSSQENTTPNKNKIQTDQTKNDSMLNRKFSVGQFFPDFDYKRATSDGILNYVRKIDADNPDRYAKMPKNPHSILNRANLQVLTGPKFQSPKQVTLDSKTEDSARQIPLRDTCERNSSLKSCIINSSDHCSNVNLCRNEHRRVYFDNVKQTKNKSQLKHILNLNNFEKSRDSIVDLILYNLMKEIIAENSDQLNEEGKIKMECLLADFIRDFKCETKNKNIQMVESVIQNLVKEIRSNDIYASNESNDLKCKPTPSKKDGKKYVKTGKVKCGRKKHGIKSQVYYEERGMAKRSNSDQSNIGCDSSFKKAENPRFVREKQIVWDENAAKYRVSQEGHQQYSTLIEKVRELENVTKQLVVVAQNQSLPLEKKYPEKGSHLQGYQNVYPILVDNNLPTHPTKTTSRTTTRRKNIVVRKVRRNILNINYLKNRSSPVVGLSRRHLKSPTTNIVINLSDWRSASRSSSSSTANGNSSVSTNDNVQGLKDESLILTVDEDVIEERSDIMHKPTMNSDNVDQSASLSRNRNSLTITISGKNDRRGELSTSTRHPIKKRRDYIKIRMMRKKLTSCGDHVNPDYRVSENKHCNDIDINEVYKLTKQYIEKQYAVKGDYLCSNLAKNLLGRDYNITTEVLGQKRNLDLAYQRMANFCMFRGLLKKKQKVN